MTEILDTHLHLVDRSRISYPWIEGAGSLERDWGLEEYAPIASQAGITRALHMEVDVAPADIEAETAMIANLAPRDDLAIAGIISACRPELDGFAAQIERAQAHDRIVGFRRVLHVVPDDLSRTDLFRQNMRRLGQAGLPFDLCVLARQLPIAAELVDAAPETQFVLDHCGVPDIAGGGFDSWARDLADLARRENVAVKVSGLPAYAAKGWRAEDLRLWTEHVTACFGPQRMVWGSDWFVCTLGGGLARWVSASRELFAALSGAERTALFSQNAERLWNLRPA